MTGPGETDDPAVQPSDIWGDRLSERLEGMSEEALDALPFGVIRLDSEGEAVFYSRTERRQSGMGQRRVLGRHFFTQVAPCMQTPEFALRIEAARRAGALDIQFEHVGDFEDETRELSVRVMSSSDGGLWLCLRRQGASS